MRLKSNHIKSPVRHPDDLSHRVVGSWEQDIAHILDDSGVDYEYESKENVVGYAEDRTYAPDFSTENYVIECKGKDWGKAFKKGYTAEQKAEAAMSSWMVKTT
jgi:hypothetical protein